MKPIIDTVSAKPVEVRYDLSKREADYPAWKSEKPLRSFLLCSHMRSGSTLLGEALYELGGMGCPIEYFHVGFQPTLAEIWDAQDQTTYIRAVYRNRTDPSGSLGVKLFWMDVMGLCLNRYPEEAESLNADLESSPDLAGHVYELVGKVFEELFPTPQFIFLTRRDRLRQAISSLKSSQVRIWRNIPGVEERVPASMPVYDYDVILNRLGQAAYNESRWQGFFQWAGIEPLRITYENLAADYEQTIRNLLIALGRWRPGTKIAAPRLRRQADQISEQFALRFLDDHKKRTRRP